MWYFITALAAAVVIFFQSAGFSRAGWDLNGVLRKKLFTATLRHDIEWFDEDRNSVSDFVLFFFALVAVLILFKTGAVTSNLADQPQKVQGLFGPTLGTVVQSCATLIGGCIIGLCYGPRTLLYQALSDKLTF